MIASGERNQRWALERPPAPDDANEVGEVLTNDTWIHVAYVWIALHTLTDVEAVRAKTIERATTHRAVMLYRRDVKTTWRLSKIEDDDEYGTIRDLYITGMRDPDGNRRDLELSLAEVRSE